ncbi:uncharacterized protein TNIN_78381 [Trichonephila inaurata madagascariensis]|uniref:Uncharacterized protein n=1 Tax=Trichonephila inaurata madagascariensis TaxID=2747483 RepID=A0A8X6Y0P6_9ARAC|nr:uncharacterized protein TNIN_78381 [Trichonephila inaurata madagascariensis]
MVLQELDIEFVQGLPDSYENCDLIVIDYLMHQLNEKVSELFTIVSHHRNVSVILLLQNLFPKCKALRDIGLNSHYIILFKNSRDMSQINCFARKLYPRNSQYMVDAYIKSPASPYQYLVVDLHPTTGGRGTQTQRQFISRSRRYLLDLQTKMKKNMKRNLEFLLLLSKSTPKQRRMLLQNADKSQIVTLSKICLNVLASNVPVNVKKLRKYKNCIPKVAC